MLFDRVEIILEVTQNNAKGAAMEPLHDLL